MAGNGNETTSCGVFEMTTLPNKSFHVKFTHSKTTFRWPPESFIKKVRRILGIKPKGSPFIKLEDKP